MRPPLAPDDALSALLPADVGLVDVGPVDMRPAVGRRHEAARSVWHGIVWSRLGRADLAWAHWDRVESPALQPWIAAERGRVLRELGLHAAAEAHERPALIAAEDPTDAAMLQISLAADAVGLGDVTEATRRLTAARAATTPLADGPRTARQRLRLGWVAVEVALLHGDVPSSDGLPWWDDAMGAPGFPPAYRWGSDFHEAKGLLFAGVVRHDLRLLAAAAAVAPPVLAWAVALARADAGVEGAELAARLAWKRIVPPPGAGQAVAATATARRLTRLAR